MRFPRRVAAVAARTSSPFYGPQADAPPRARERAPAGLRRMGGVRPSRRDGYRPVPDVTGVTSAEVVCSVIRCSAVRPVDVPILRRSVKAWLRLGESGHCARSCPITLVFIFAPKDRAFLFR